MASPAFPDAGIRPDLAVLAREVGASFALINGALEHLGAEGIRITANWKFSKLSGWYVTYDKGQRRLFYLFPQQGDLLLKLVLNEKGMAGLAGHALPTAMQAQVDRAAVHAEGTVLELTARSITGPAFTELLRIKLRSVS